MEAIIGLILMGWLAASILNQFRFSWFQRFRQYDSFSLLPIWSFFAPNPGQSDYHLVFRDRQHDGSHSEWSEIEITEPRKP